MYTCFLWKNCCVRQRKKWEHDCPKQVLKCANKYGTISQNGAIKVIWYNMSRIWKSSHHVSHITDLVLGSRSVGFTSATFFSQSKMSQSSLNWDILNTVQGQQCHIVLPKIVQNCSTWPKLARQRCSKLLEMTQAGPKKLLKIAQNESILLKFAQNCSKLLEMSQNVSKCFKMSHNGPTSV